MGRCFGKDGSPQEDVNMIVGDGGRSLGAMAWLFNTSSRSLGVTRKLFERAVLRKVTKGALT